MRRFTRVALEQLVELGASYELFDTSQPLPDPAAVTRCDGLLMLGGGDVDGRLYGVDHQHVPNSYGVDIRADHDGIAAAEAAQAADLPVLAICRGPSWSTSLVAARSSPTSTTSGCTGVDPTSRCSSTRRSSSKPARAWRGWSARTRSSCAWATTRPWPSPG